MAIGTTAAILGSAAIGVGASLIGARGSANAAREASRTEAEAAQQAADAQVQAQREALQAQREYQNYLDRTLRPEINAGANYNAALDALTFGQGSPSGYRLPAQATRATEAGGYTSGGYSVPQGASAEQLYLQANPDVAAWADATQQATGRDVNALAQQHYAQYGANEGRLSPDQLAAQAAGQAGQGGNQPATEPGQVDEQPQVMTRANVMEQIAQNPLTLAGQAEADQIDRITEQQYNDATGAAGQFRDQEIGRIDNSDRESRAVLDAYLAQQRQQLDAERQRREAENDAEQGQLTSYLTGRRGAAGSEAQRRYNELDSGRDIRLGNLNNYISAWDRGARVARDRSEDQVFSRGGVTGMIGNTQRGVAQVNEDYARDRATTEAQGVSSIWERYLTEKPQIGRDLYGENADLDAYGYEGGRGIRSDRRQIGQFAFDTGAGLDQEGYRTGQALSDRRYDRTGDAVSGYYDDMGRYRDSRADIGRRTASMRGDAARAGYGNQLDLLQAGANRRDRLLERLTGAQGNFADQQSRTATNIGNAQAQGYLGAGQARAGGGLAAADAWSTGFNNAAKSVGDYWAQRNRSSLARGASTPSHNPYADQYDLYPKG